MQNDRPAKWWWGQICQHCRKLWWSSYIEPAAEMLPKDGFSKVAWPLRPCNVCLFFTWRRATVIIEGFLMVVCCLKVNRLCHLFGGLAQLKFVCWNYGQTSNIRHTLFQNLNVSHLVLQLSVPNPLNPGVKSIMKMQLEQRRQAMLQLHLSDEQFYCLLKCNLY